MLPNNDRILQMRIISIPLCQDHARDLGWDTSAISALSIGSDHAEIRPYIAYITLRGKHCVAR